MSIQEKIQKLLSLGMNTGRELNKYGNTPLADYLTLSLKDKSLVIPDFLSFSLFQQALTNFLSDQAIYTKEQSQRFAEQISVAPFIQRVDHGELFLDKGTFLNNLFYQIAARENNIPFLLTKQCTRVKCTTNRQSLLGAGYIRSKDNVFKIFDKSKSHLKIATLETLDDVKITYDPQDKTKPYKVHPLLKKYIGSRFKHATDAVAQINYDIWGQLQIKDKRPILLVNEKFCSDLIALHLDNPQSPIYSILMERDVLKSFMESYKFISSNPAKLLKRTTDLFWIRDGIALKPLRYSPEFNRLDLIEGGKVLKSIPMERDTLKQNLQNRTIYPDIVLAYLSINILTGLTAYGGTAQHEYLPAIKEILLDLDKKKHILSPAARKDIENSHPSSLNFSSLLSISPEISDDLENLNSSYDLNAFEKRITKKTLLELVGDLSKISYMTAIEKPNPVMIRKGSPTLPKLKKHITKERS